jgi:hypothetical protein
VQGAEVGFEMAVDLLDVGLLWCSKLFGLLFFNALYRVLTILSHFGVLDMP